MIRTVYFFPDSPYFGLACFLEVLERNFKSQKAKPQPKKKRDPIQETSEDSFPASDPPAWTITTGEKNKKHSKK